MNIVSREKVRRMVAGAALAASVLGTAATGATLLGAGSAQALPISTLQTECRGAGGTWYTNYTYSGGIRSVSGYECWYRDIHGDGYVDFYDRRGNYYGTG